MAKEGAKDPEVMTTPEACRFLRIDKRTYYALDDNHVRQLFAAALDHLVE